MTACDPLDGCGTTCLGCGRTWCRDNETSPGEPDGICPDCWNTDSPEDAA